MARKILVLGASGMLGSACIRALGGAGDHVVGSIRDKATISRFPESVRARLIPGIDALDFDSVTRLLAATRPDVVVNCIGVVKQLAEADDPLKVLPLNTVLPLRLEQLCEFAGARLVHFSTDCVFSGSKGNYIESDTPDAADLYGISKRFGEVRGPSAVTLRTSIIGHELASCRSLISWFLSQDGQVKGFTKAVFSGLPTVEIARVVRDFVIPNPNLNGVYHVSAGAISKYELLRLVAEIYDKNILIEPSSDLIIDRSLNSAAFRAASGYEPPPWRNLIQSMHDFA